jgi:hypothetical protein
MPALWQSAHVVDGVTDAAWHAEQLGPPATPCSVATLEA